MIYVFELYFEPAGETAVRQLWHLLATAGFNDYMQQAGSTPHVTLGGFAEEGFDLALAQSQMDAFAAQIQPFALTLSHLGVFNTSPGVVYAGATMSFLLLDIHRHFHIMAADVGKRPFAYYLPDTWVPHCTLAERVPPNQIGQVVDHCRQLQLPLTTQAIRLGLIQVEQNKVRDLYSVALG